MSDHAVQRHEERFPGTMGREARRFLIAKDVGAALTECRVSTREPRFSGNPGRLGKMNGHERDRSIRFCWNADESAVYMLDRQRGGQTIVVITTIRPGEAV